MRGAGAANVVSRYLFDTDVATYNSPGVKERWSVRYT
jgi:hypothetical protein